MLRRDGSVVQTPGYDRATGLVYQPNARYPAMPERPSEAQVSGALNALRDVVVDFPFRGQAHFAAWLAALLTPLARRPPDPGENTVTTVTPAWGGTRSHCQSWRVLAGIR